MMYIPIVDVPITGQKVTETGIPTAQFQKLLEAIQDSINVKAYTVATVPDATKNRGRQIPVTDESGGETIAFSDGTNWRRVQDRAVIT